YHAPVAALREAFGAGGGGSGAGGGGSGAGGGGSGAGGGGSGRLYLMIARHRAATDRRLEHELRARAASFCIPVVAGTEVLYHTRGRRELQDVMTCIRHGVTLSTAGRRIRSNAGHALLAPHAFRTLFADDPLAVQQGLEIAA